MSRCMGEKKRTLLGQESMGKDTIEQVTSQGTAAVSQFNLEGEEWIPGSEMHRCEG